MLKFCQRLVLSENINDAIHQWTGKNFTQALVELLLENPDCVYELSLSSSAVWYLINWTSIQQALKLRIDRVLNETHLDDGAIARIARNWLSHFRLHPDKLNLIFYNLDQSADNRNAIAKDNYFKIRKSCWNYLECPGEYSDTAFQSLYVKFHDPKIFDPILHKQASEQLLLDNPAQGARLLALTQVPLPENFSNQRLVSLLVHSVHEDSLSNWQKINQRLEHKPLLETIHFFKALMDNVLQAAFNPVLVEKAYELLTHNPYFDELIKQFSEQEVLWLIQHASADILEKYFLHGFDLLIQQHGVLGFNLGALLTALPEDQDIAARVLSHSAFETPDNMAGLFVQLAGSTHSERLLVSLHKVIISHDSAWIQAFLMKVQASLQADKASMMAAHVLNACLLTVRGDLKTEKSKHRDIVRLQLVLLNNLFNNSGDEVLQKECLQLVLNLLTQFCQVDWVKINFQSKPFAEAIIHWLGSLNLSQVSNALHQHPLACLFLDNLTVPLNRDLKSHPRFQLFIKRLLDYPSATMNEAHYLLFDLLDSNYQKDLIKELVEIKHRHPVHTAIMPFIAKAMSISELYQIFTQHPGDFLIVEAIFGHSEGLNELSPPQRFQLIEAIESGEQVLQILNGYTHVNRRIAFVTSFYEYCHDDWRRVSEKFSKWGLNKQTFAAIANFTKENTYQQLLSDLLQNKPFYGQYLDDYIRYPSMDMGLEPDSYLKNRVRQMQLINGPEPGLDATFLAYFEPKFVFENLKNRFDTSLQRRTMAKTLEPMQDCDAVLDDALSAARWFHQLPLYSEGVALILKHYINSDAATQQIIGQTQLYNTVIMPLLGFEQPGCDLMSLSKHLPRLLTDYANDLNASQPEHSLMIKQALAAYQSKLTTMASFAPLRLYDFFKPDSVFVRHDSKKNAGFLAQDSDLLTGRPDTQAVIAMNLALKKAMTAAFKKPDVMSDDAVHHWLFETIFISPMSSFIDKPLLRQYFQSLSPKVWTAKLLTFHQQHQQLLAGLDDLAPLAHYDSFDAVVDYLDSFDTTKINGLSAVASKMNMLHIADFLRFVLYIRMAPLSVKRILYQLLPQSSNNDLGVEWLNSEAREIENCKQFLSSRYESLVMQGFVCHANDADIVPKLNALKAAYSRYLPPDLLTSCLNSYHVVFSMKDGPRFAFLKALDEILRSENQAIYIINAMQGDLVRDILEEAMNAPLLHQSLLHQMLNSNYQLFCQQQLEQRLFAILRFEEDENTLETEALYAALIETKSAGLSSEECMQVTAIFRLLAIVNPQREFAALKGMDFLTGQTYKKQAFIADVSSYQMLCDLYHYPLTNQFDASMAWLEKQCHESPFMYKGTIDAALGPKPEKYPLPYYHWMLWREQLDSQSMHFIDGFLHWLNRLEESDLTVNTALSSLFQIIADKGLLSPLCSRVIEVDCLKPGQLDWLSKAMVLLDRFKPEYLMEVIRISTPKRLEKMMPLITQHPLASLSLEEIIALLKRLSDQTLKAILITHLLGRDEFINRLPGSSLLEQLSGQSTVSSPRLQPFLSQLHIHLLTTETIGYLTKEAVVSCFFSVQHFHEWSEEQISALLARHPDNAIFKHWICHYAMMPNAIPMLHKMLKHADSNIFEVIDEIMEASEKKALLSRLIKHKDLCEFSIPKIVEKCDESHLIEAIQQYNDGFGADIKQLFIRKLLSRLLNEKHRFSAEAIHSLFSLQNKVEFIGKNSKLAALCNQYLRTAAASSNIDIFYEAGSFSFSRTKINLSLQPPAPENEVQVTFQDAIAQLLQQKSPQTLPDENPAIEALIKLNKPVKAIDYFLMHYQGKGSKLNKLLSAYLGRFKWMAPKDLNPLHNLAILMRRNETPDMVKKAIFSTFISHPALLDDTFISQRMFLFEPVIMIKNYGMAKKYQPLIDTCHSILDNEALKSSLEKKIITMMEKVCAEAKFEQDMKGMSGSFLKLRRWFHRCLFYGWHGFFVPNESPHVAPFDKALAATAFQQKIAAHLNPSLTVSEALKVALKSGYYKNIHDTLGRYQNNASDDAELSIRQAVDTAYQPLLREAPFDSSLEAWLKDNQQPFLDNRQRILECLLTAGKLAEVRQCLDLFANGPGDFAKIREAFMLDDTFVLLPAVTNKTQPDIKTKIQEDLKSVVVTAAGSIYRVAEYIGIGRFFLRSPPTWFIEQETAESTSAAGQKPGI